MYPQPCTHFLAYVVSKNGDIGNPLSQVEAFWECPSCGARGPTVDSIDAAAEDLRAQTATKH